MKSFKLWALSLSLMTTTAFAGNSQLNSLDDLNPFAPDIEETLLELDADYTESTGKSPFLNNDSAPYSRLSNLLEACYQRTCSVFIDVNKATQSAELFENGELIASFAVSTGTAGHSTPNFDKRPNGRIYDKYSSSKYPGGDFDGLGNMPYAVFIHGGFAMHGTPRGNWPKLGQRASHGCIRMHPDNAKVFNRLVRKYGINQSWITVR